MKQSYIGEKVKAKAKKITNNGVVLVIIDEESTLKDRTAFLHISKITSGFVKNIRNEIKIGDELFIEIINQEEDKLYARLLEKLTKHKGKIIEKKEEKNIDETDFEYQMKKFIEDSREIQKTIKQGIERRRNKRLYRKKKRKK